MTLPLPLVPASDRLPLREGPRGQTERMHLDRVGGPNTPSSPVGDAGVQAKRPCPKRAGARGGGSAASLRWPSLRCAAKQPAYRTGCTRGGGTHVASFSNRSHGASWIPVVRRVQRLSITAVNDGTSRRFLVKKSVAHNTSMCVRINSFQVVVLRRPGAGGMPRRLRILPTA